MTPFRKQLLIKINQTLDFLESETEKSDIADVTISMLKPTNAKEEDFIIHEIFIEACTDLKGDLLLEERTGYTVDGGHQTIPDILKG